MKCKYTKHQIIESIKHWQKRLQSMNEAEDQLLQALSDAFEKSKLFSKTYKGKFNEDFFRRAYDILNEHFFSSKLDEIPVYYKADADIRDFLVKREYDLLKIPLLFFGTHSVILENDKNTLKWTDDLDLHDDVILLNKDHIEDKSLIFAIACLCHEMIHYYDRLFGEYCDFIKYSVITGIDKNIHNTLTFEDMKDKANELGINVIQEIPKNRSNEVLDKDAIELLYKQAQEHGLILEGEEREKADANLSNIAFLKSGGAVITTF